MKKEIATTNNSIKVFIDTDYAHFDAHKNVSLMNVKKAIEKSEWNPPFGFISFISEEINGKTDLVKTSREDKCIWAKRLGRNNYSRILPNGEKQNTNQINVGICLDDDGLATIFTYFYGEMSPKELSDKRLKPEELNNAINFWSSHALVSEYTEIIFEEDIKESSSNKWIFVWVDPNGIIHKEERMIGL